jgi:hypothetical protein
MWDCKTNWAVGLTALTTRSASFGLGVQFPNHGAAVAT